MIFHILGAVCFCGFVKGHGLYLSYNAILFRLCSPYPMSQHTGHICSFCCFATAVKWGDSQVSHHQTPKEEGRGKTQGIKAYYSTDALFLERSL